MATRSSGSRQQRYHPNRHPVRKLLGDSSDSEDEEQELEEEEEEDSGDSEDSSEGSELIGAKLALGIDPDEILNFDPELDEATNGSQFLLKMRAERKKVPTVAVAPKTPGRSKCSEEVVEEAGNATKNHVQPIIPLRPELLTTPEWQQEVMDTFRHLRRKAAGRREYLISSGERFDLASNAAAFQFTFTHIHFDPACGKFEKTHELKNESSLEKFQQKFVEPFFTEPPTPPAAINTNSSSTTTQLMRLPARTLESLLSYHLNWIRNNNNAPVHNTQLISLYSLLVVLEEPLEGAVVADLRDIVKLLREQRLNIGRLMMIAEEEEESVKLDEIMLRYIKALNLFVVLVGIGFGQRDLLDKLD